MSEKRKAERIAKKVLVCFEGPDFSIYSQTRDVSDHGVFISTHYILSPGTEITLRMEEALPMERKGKVVHLSIQDDDEDMDTTGFGVEFS